MLKWRIYTSLVIGIGFTLLIFFTMDITWILAVAALMPGIGLALVLFPHSASQIPMLIGNSLIYSAIAFPIVSVVMRRSKTERPLRFASIATIAAITVIGGGWFGGNYYKQSGRGSCKNEIVSELVAPDGTYKVVTFVRDCGATTDASTQVALLEPTRQLNHADRGNIFVADSAHEAPVNGQGAIDVRIAWTSPTTMNVQYPGMARGRLKKNNYRNISVNYETK